MKTRNRGKMMPKAIGRANVPRVIEIGRGLSNIPKMGEHGSAAYRRRQAALTRVGRY